MLGAYCICYSLRFIVRNLRWLGDVLSVVCQQSARSEREMCRLLPLKHVQFLRAVRYLPPRLRNVLWKLLQPVHKLFRRPPGAHQRSLPAHMQQEPVLRQDLVNVPVL